MPKSEEEFYKKLRQRESSNRYHISYGDMLGAYQLSKNYALVDIGYVDRNGNWTGKNGIKSQEDFLNNPKVQDEAVREYHKLITKRTKEITDKYHGKIINGIAMTRSAILAGSHLIGYNRMINYLDADGNPNADKYGFKDKNRTSVEEYLKKFEDYDVSNVINIPYNKEKDSTAEEQNKRKYDELKKKYPKAEKSVIRTTKNEFKKIEQEISGMQNEVNNLRKSGYFKNYKGTITGKAALIYDNKKDKPYWDKSFVNFDGISLNGKYWRDWSELEKKSFIEGFNEGKLGNPDKYPWDKLNKNNNDKKHWTDEFNIGNPDTDNGHWVTMPNGKHLFIKD